MTRVPFTKTQTIGNDFVLIEAGLVDRLEDFAMAVCERRFGVGSDGLLVVGPGDGRIDMRMFNPDGTEDYCGNGLRCAAFYAVNRGWAAEEFVVRQKGIDAAVFVRDGLVTATHAPPEFSGRAVPLREGLESGIDMSVQGEKGTALSTGSAHFVTIVDQLPGDQYFQEISPLIENDARFPERVSVMWTQPIGERRLRLRIWERGVGPTLGCGTGSMAAAAEWSRRTGVTGEIEVENPGGLLLVTVAGAGQPIRAASRPIEPFSGYFDWDSSQRLMAERVSSLA